jgi:hypothetical protein
MKPSSYQDSPTQKSQPQKILVLHNASEKNPERPSLEDSCSEQNSAVQITTPTMGQHSESHPTISETKTHQPETAQNSAEHTLEEMGQDEARGA